MNRPVGLMMIGANGSIATTLTTGLFAARRGLCSPIGMPTEALGGPAAGLMPIGDFALSGWDLLCDASHGSFAVQRAEAPPQAVSAVQDELDSVKVFAGVGLGVSAAVSATMQKAPVDRSRADAAKRVESEIRSFIQSGNLAGAVVVNLASTEPAAELAEWHGSLEAFEAALALDDSRITAAMIYAYAAIRAGCPIINYTPSDMFEIPALKELALRHDVPLAGRDGKTGQTFYKQVLANAFKQRGLLVDGWYSTNLLGNGDGQILKHDENGKRKRQSKLATLDGILDYSPDHQVHIHYYRPRRGQKEAWDVIDLRGWLDASIQMRINWIAPDSALAAPMILDLARIMWWAKQRGQRGLVTFLGVYFKEPLECLVADFDGQCELLKRTLCGE